MAVKLAVFVSFETTVGQAKPTVSSAFTKALQESINSTFQATFQHTIMSIVSTNKETI